MRTEEAGVARYALNDEITLRTPEGVDVRGYVQAEEDTDGMIEVWTEYPINGRKVNVFSKDELDAMVVGTRFAPEAESVEAEDASRETTPVPAHEEQEQEEAQTEAEEEATDSRLGRSMTEDEAEDFLDEITENPEVAPALELTRENWEAEFGEEGQANTPIGLVHLGENQFQKMMQEGRSEKLGMIRPTLERPDVIIKDVSRSEADAEREHSYIFIKAIKGKGKKRLYYFTSVSVSQDGKEVIISNQERRRGRVLALLTSGEVLYLKPDSLHPFAQVESSVSLNDSRVATPAETITTPHGVHSSDEASSEDKVNEKTDEVNPEDESLHPEEAYDALLDVVGGDTAMAEKVVTQMVADKEAELQSARKSKPRKAKGVTDIAQALLEKEAKEREAEASLEHWKAVASVPAQRAEEEAKERVRQLAPNAQPMSDTDSDTRIDTPEWHDDTPSDARDRGYIRIEGMRIDRQGALEDAVLGAESAVKFASNDTQTARYALIDADTLQPSHRGGVKNPLHFIPEAQPKDRADFVSDQAAIRIASHINPKEITLGATAYTGAPTINTRGEVIQGNSRADALRLMWESYREGSGNYYKQYLIDHADKLGIAPEAIEQMASPVLVHMADVSDARAIELGQYRQSDIESGGIERINPKTLYTKLGDKRGNFARALLDTGDEDASIDALLVRNGVETLKWLNRGGFITDTQYASAFDKGGSVTAEAKEDLKQTLYQSFFEGGYNGLESDFEALPKRIQKALLGTAYRDQQSPKEAQFLGGLQEGINAYNTLMTYAPFAEARSVEDAERAMADWLRLGADLVTGNIPSEMYSNFALRLAVCYKFDTQRGLSGKLKEVYDAVQAVPEETIFGVDEETIPKTLSEAIKHVFGVEYNPNNEQDNGSDGSDAPSRHSEASPSGSSRGSGTPASDEQGASAGGQADGGGRADGDPQGGQITPEETTTSPEEEGESQAQEATGAEERVPDYTVSDIQANKGGNFIQNSQGSIDLVSIPLEVFDAIGIPAVPFRITESMAQHVLDRHGKELQLETAADAVRFIVDVMQHFDHVRLGDKANTYIFSVENGRKKVGKRAVTLVLPSEGGDYLGVSTSGYESIAGIRKRTLLWEEGAKKEAPATETASANVPTPSATQGGMTGGSASNQDNVSENKGSEKAGTFLDVIKLLYEKGKDAAGKVFGMKFFDVANTSDLLKGLGLTGDKFTIRYGVISRHFGKDQQHDLPLDVWERLPEALNNPLVVSKYYTSEGKQKGYRIYTSIQLEDGSFVMVSAEVKSSGRGIEVNAINTVFGRQSVSNTQEEVLYESNEMTPEQRTLLNRTNPHQYSAPQESLSEDKGSEKEIEAGDRVDSQGNPLNEDGTLYTEEISDVADLRDEDFTHPSRSVVLPQLPENVDEAIGADGKRVVIKKNIFEKNARSHKDLTPAQSRDILQQALYSPDLYGQNQKTKRPYNWVVINTKDEKGKNRAVVLELSPTKDNIEIVHWHYVRSNSLDQIKRQAEREGGLILILPSEISEEAGGLSSRTQGLSSEDKGREDLNTGQSEGTISADEDALSSKLKHSLFLVKLYNGLDEDFANERKALEGREDFDEEAIKEYEEDERRLALDMLEEDIEYA